MAKKHVRSSTASWKHVKVEPALMGRVKAICKGRFQMITPVVNDVLLKWVERQEADNSQSEKV